MTFNWSVKITAGLYNKNLGDYSRIKLLYLLRFVLDLCSIVRSRLIAGIVGTCLFNDEEESFMHPCGCIRFFQIIRSEPLVHAGHAEPLVRYS